MGIFNYIFIFLLLSFGLIESKSGRSRINGRGGPPEEAQDLFIRQVSSRPFILPFQDGLVGSSFFQLSDNILVINEIMADPTPVAGLPEREYLELFNCGSSPVNLKNWILELGSKQKTFPDLTVLPGGFLLVVAPGGAKELELFGKTIEISGFGVTNSGMVLSLYDSGKRLVDQVAYLPGMHTKGFGEGGFSLERIDPVRMCGQAVNWATTLSPKGGTPGAVNSIFASNPDHLPPQVVSTTYKIDLPLEIQFNERVSIPVAVNELLKEIPDGIEVDSVKLEQGNQILKIWFQPLSVISGVNYSMVLQGVKDECGNGMADYLLKYGYYLPERSDLLISEVLFNPYPQGFDFVEIYNNCAHKVDLSDLSLATRDELMGLKQISSIALNQDFLEAGAYLAVTRSRAGVVRFYPSSWQYALLEAEKFPSLSDESGMVVLLGKRQEVLDEMSYNDHMHDPLISEKEGISLERVSFDLPAARKENWHSAAKSAGFATPGYKNSSGTVLDSTRQMVKIDPVIFSPNGDQINDQLNINLFLGEPGWILNITILNCAGRVVRNLANNLTTGSSDVLVWDGLGDDCQVVELGIYLLNFSFFHPSGKIHKKRFTCVVTDHL